MARTTSPSGERLADDQDLASRLTEEQLHIWEHAALLYHSYEWQAAANFFALLSKDIDDPQLRSLCLLNTALIMARLGEFEISQSYIEFAAHAESTPCVTAFIAGIVACELENYAFAQHCFRMCWQDLRIYGAIDFGDVGLDFLLDSETVWYNYQQMNRAHQPGPIHAIPAEIIFEAPQPTVATPRADQQDRHELLCLQKLSNGSCTPSVSVEPFTHVQDGDLSPMSSRPVLSCVPEPLHVASKKDQFELTNGPIRSITCPTTQKPEPLSWRGRPKTPYVPRDPRVINDPTDELAAFIREAPAETKHQAPRDPRAVYEPTQELSTFAQAYAPENVRTKAPEPFALRQSVVDRARVKARLNDRFRMPTVWNVQRESISSDYPSVHSSDRRVYSTRVDSATTLSSTSQATHLEFLQPAVYRPASKKIKMAQLSETFEGSESDRKFSRPSYDRESPASDSSFEDFKQRQREHTLGVLEGRHAQSSSSNASFPFRSNSSRSEPELEHGMSPWPHQSPSPVESERFFEKILGHVRRF